MALFDFLSGSDEAEEAAARNRAEALQGYGRANEALSTYQTGALGSLGEGLTASSGALQSNLRDAIRAYKQGQATAASAYTPLSDLGSDYGRAVNMYQNALGLNGPGGVRAAQGAFTTSPGYQFAVDEAT